MTAQDGLDAGRAAAEAGDWGRSRDLLAAADADAPLAQADLDRLGFAHLFTGDSESALATWQRAFAGATRAAEPRAAGVAAVRLTLLNLAMGRGAIGMAWLSQAAQRLEGDYDCPEFGWLDWLHTEVFAQSSGDRAAALARAVDLSARSARLGNLDTENLGKLLQCQLLIRMGRLEAGLALFDEVIALSTTGLLGPFATAWIHCAAVSTCTSAGDYHRAWEWSQQIERCTIGPPAKAGFPGDCRMHRAELLRVRGNWISAEIALASVCEQVGGWHPGHAGQAYAELGMLSLHRGDLDAAAVAFVRAREYGSAAQPGLTELALARGEVEVAVEGIGVALADPALDPPQRAVLVAAAVEAAVAGGRLDWAADLVEELRCFTADAMSPAYRARALAAAARLAAARSELPAARAAAEEAVRLWVSVPAPYEAARVQVELASVLLAAGDPVGHSMALSTAHDAFRKLGATRDMRRVAELLGRPVNSQRVERALMFTDIEGSTSLLARLGDERWIELLRRHDTQLRQSFVRHQGVEVHQKGGGDGFFVAFVSAAAALDCALEIQERLRAWEDQRLAVRIGVHWATVTHTDGDFSGRGVHEAARISALASGSQILTSEVTVAAAGKPYAVGEIHEVELRGLPGTALVTELTVGCDQTRRP